MGSIEDRENQEGEREPLIRARLPELTLGLLMLVSGVLLLRLTASIGFLSDEWQFLFFRQGFGSGLTPYYEHLVLFPTWLYSAMVQIFGMESDRPMQVLAILAFLGMNLLLFVYLRRRVGDWAAVIGTALILFLGAAFEDLLFAFQINYFGSIACGLGALVALDRDDRRGDISASLLLVAGIGFSSMAFPFIAAVAVEWALNPRDRKRRIFVPGAAILTWILWWIGWGHEADSQLGLSGIVDLPAYLFKAIPAAFVSLAGLATDDGTSPDQPHLIWGRILFLLALFAAGWRIRRLGRVPAGVWVTTAAALAFFLLAGLNASDFRLPTSSRYQLPGAILLLLVAANLLHGLKISRNSLVVGAVLAALAVFGGVRLMERQATDRWQPASLSTRTALGALDLAGAAIKPDYQVDLRTNREEDRLIPISLYRETTAEHGSPGLTAPEIQAADPAHRAQADALMIDASGIVLNGFPSAVSGPCLRVRGSGGVHGPYEAKPGSYLILNGGRTPLTVSMSRFSDPPGQPIGPVLPVTGAGLNLPGDEPGLPWLLFFTGAGPVTVCPTG